MLNWPSIDTVLLDMDGTLLDLHFDNYFWKEFVPLRYAERHGLAHEQAKQQLVPRFKAMEGRLEWYCLDHWSADLQLNIAALKREMAELIAVHPHVIAFLEQVRRSGRQLVLVTNAHRDSLTLKMEKTCLAPFFDAIVCSHDYGLAKEQTGFWGLLACDYGFDPLRTLLVDDSLPVLDSAQAFGMGHLVSISKPDSRAAVKQITAYPAIEDFQALMLGL